MHSCLCSYYLHNSRVFLQNTKNWLMLRKKCDCHQIQIFLWGTKSSDETDSKKQISNKDKSIKRSKNYIVTCLPQSIGFPRKTSWRDDLMDCKSFRNILRSFVDAFFWQVFFQHVKKNVTAVNEQRLEGLLHINVSNNKIGLLANKLVSRTRIFSVKKILFRLRLNW